MSAAAVARFPRSATRPTPVPAPEPAVIALGPNEGQKLWFLDQLVIVKQRGQGLPYGVLETELAKDRGTPFHRHLDEAESFYVLEGELSFFVEGGKVLHGSPGSYVHVPAGVAHGFHTHTHTRLLVISNPQGFVDFTRDYGEPAPGLELPPSAAPDFPRLQALATKYRIELLGPLPEIG